MTPYDASLLPDEALRKLDPHEVIPPGYTSWADQRLLPWAIEYDRVWYDATEKYPYDPSKLDALRSFLRTSPPPPPTQPPVPWALTTTHAPASEEWVHEGLCVLEAISVAASRLILLGEGDSMEEDDRSDFPVDYATDMGEEAVVSREIRAWRLDMEARGYVLRAVRRWLDGLASGAGDDLGEWMASPRTATEHAAKILSKADIPQDARYGRAGKRAVESVTRMLAEELGQALRWLLAGGWRVVPLRPTIHTGHGLTRWRLRRVAPSTSQG